MPNIVHRIGMEKASPEEVFQAVATRDGHASWWTEKVMGESKVGNELQFRFETGGLGFSSSRTDFTEARAMEVRCGSGSMDRYTRLF